MHRPPEALQVGEYFSQEKIKETFDTGFDYRISGINPRRDSNDNRYMLVFANEDGPYGDSVRQGPVDHIGLEEASAWRGCATNPSRQRDRGRAPA